MSETHPGPVVGFSAGERDYIRRELDMFFSTFPTVADEFLLKTWRGGPQAGQPKLPPAANGPPRSDHRTEPGTHRRVAPQQYQGGEQPGVQQQRARADIRHLPDQAWPRRHAGAGQRIGRPPHQRDRRP